MLRGYAGTFARFPRALHRFVESPLSLDQAHELVRAQTGGRQASFLRLLRESVYGHLASPYGSLLELVGCELGDVSGALPTVHARRLARGRAAVEEARTLVRIRRLRRQVLQESGGRVLEQFGTKSDDLLREIVAGRCRRFDPRLASRVPNGVEHELGRFYYDTAQASHPAALAALLAIVPPSQLLFGSDFPYRTAAEHATGLAAHGLGDADLRAIERDNALGLMPRPGAGSR